MRFVRDNGLSIAFGVLFLATLVAQALVGHADFNDQAIAHHEGTVSLGRYVTSSNYGTDVLENWQSEYLQFTLFILATIWLLQRGSTESKEMDKAGQESDQAQKVGGHAQRNSPLWARVGGLRRWVFSWSLLLVMFAIWIASWAAQWVTGRVAYNAEQLTHHEPAVSLFGYLGTSDFWNRTFQNWQSEFLAVGSMAILSVYLRARGSAESKPVGSPHGATGVEG